jgi:hypothetical protein
MSGSGSKLEEEVVPMTRIFNSLRFRMISLVLLAIILAMGLAIYNGQQNKKSQVH